MGEKRIVCKFSERKQYFNPIQYNVMHVTIVCWCIFYDLMVLCFVLGKFNLIKTLRKIAK
jgi:hypothetical protein